MTPSLHAPVDAVLGIRISQINKRGAAVLRPLPATAEAVLDVLVRCRLNFIVQQAELGKDAGELDEWFRCSDQRIADFIGARHDSKRGIASERPLRIDQIKPARELLAAHRLIAVEVDERGWRGARNSFRYRLDFLADNKLVPIEPADERARADVEEVLDAFRLAPTQLRAYKRWRYTGQLIEQATLPELAAIADIDRKTVRDTLLSLTDEQLRRDLGVRVEIHQGAGVRGSDLFTVSFRPPGYGLLIRPVLTTEEIEIGLGV